MREIITDWQTAGGSGFVTVMYFDEEGALSDQRDEIASLWAAFEDYQHSTTRWTVRTTGRLVAPATGTLTGLWADPTPLTAVGDGSGTPAPDSSQLLLRWNTPAIVNGRRVMGRSFVPGFTVNSVSVGNVAAGLVGNAAAAGNILTDAGVGFGVWHRPTGGSGGSLHLATSASCWSEWAIQRGRRG